MFATVPQRSRHKLHAYVRASTLLREGEVNDYGEVY
jgi:hypothetical protein